MKTMPAVGFTREPEKEWWLIQPVLGAKLGQLFGRGLVSEDSNRRITRYQFD
jgi:hypothetical protein